MPWRCGWSTLLAVTAWFAGTCLLAGQSGPDEAPRPRLLPPVVEAPAQPAINDSGSPPQLNPAQTAPTDRLLPINLATALRLADARPLIIQAAQASVESEAGRLLQAQALWLPTLRIGMDYERHDGALDASSGAALSVNGNEQMLLGAGASALFALTDAIYAPLSERQLVRARQFDVQTARNDALLDVASAFFLVQQARGVLAGYQDTIIRAQKLAKRIEGLGVGLVTPIELERVRTTLFELEEAAATARQDWRISSARLTRTLRLDPVSVVVPLEPPSLTVTLIPPTEPLDALIPVALTNRPELASQQAIVQATLLRLKQERVRPLIPSIILQGVSDPSDTLGVGAFGSGLNHLGSWGARSDWDVQVFWELRNLGFGNLGLVREKQGDQRRAMIELFRLQDEVAAEVTEAHAEVEGAESRVRKAEQGLKSSLASYVGNIKGLSETVKRGEFLELVIRPQEAVAALLQLQQAYGNYYVAIGDYNRAEFTLFRALGYPAQGVACGNQLGATVPVDFRRTAPLGSDLTPPCSTCPK